MSKKEYIFTKKWNITSQDAQQISKLTKCLGQRTLARKLMLGPLNEEENLRETSLLDYYYDTLQFTVTRGFPWNEVAYSLSFAYHFISHSVDGDLAMAIRALHETAAQYVKRNLIELKNAKLLAQYFATTFLPSFRLYKFVFTEKQEDLSRHEMLLVQTPQETMALKDADTIEVWKFHQKLNKISDDEVKRKENLDSLRLNIEERMKMVSNEIESNISKDERTILAMNEAETVITSATEKQMQILETNVYTHLQEMQDAAEIALLRKSLPVPADMKTNSASLSKTNQGKADKKK